jgi:hypothetical protein
MNYTANKNRPERKGMLASARYPLATGRHTLYAVHTRGTAVTWFVVSDSEVDEVGCPLILRQDDNPRIAAGDFESGAVLRRLARTQIKMALANLDEDDGDRVALEKVEAAVIFLKSLTQQNEPRWSHAHVRGFQQKS